MIRIFIHHEIKAFLRTVGAGKSIAVKIVLAILILYLLLNVLALGFFMDKILEEVAPNEDLIASFSKTILYYFLVDLLMRFQLQELPTLQVQPYLHLRIKKNVIVRYLSFVSLLSFFNLWPVILFLPFIFKVIWVDAGHAAALFFIVAILGFTIFNNYLSLYIKRKSNLNGWVYLGYAALLILLTTADFSWHLYSIRNLSSWFFHGIIQHYWFALLPVILAAVMYFINFLYLKDNLYLEELGSKKAAYKNSTDIPFFNRFGKIGDLVSNEIKLILRNKRSRSSIIMTGAFLFYGILFYTNKSYSDSMKLFPAIFMTGLFIINYGQFMFSWQGSHFDGILISKISFSDFLKAKFLLFTTVSTLAFLLTLPYVYFGWHVIFIHLMMYLWNIGVNTVIVLFFANRNYKRIDLSKGASFNWEGVGATQLLLGLPLILCPYLIYLPGKWLGNPDIGLILIGLTGVLFVLMRNYWIRQLEADFEEKKYTIAEGFRNK
ncbi:DUF5687 family protein [Mucilaginibacter arboris]|uniref:Uncharacterized protein n=1 Tax=Mucilaginibacter arboris TaxID=2682090 RepID=A0A7K1SVP0_9SPHI|nr:DUF5687 family protein [Mucilaginibacter arboris]MVN21353.1 hypothetical protein [Mucilaginibacter arboris]